MDLDLWEASALSYERTGERAFHDEMKRLAHSMKGSAQAIGVDDLARVLHRFEQVLDHPFSARAELVSVVLQFIDLMREYFSVVRSRPDTIDTIGMITGKMIAVLSV